MRHNPLLLAIAVGALFVGIALAAAGHAATVSQLAIHDPALAAGGRLTVASPAFGAAIPRRFTAFGEGVSPPLRWSRGPRGTASYVLILEDPDAPVPVPFQHWLVWDIAPSTHSIALGGAPAGSRQGKLMLVGKVGYMAPQPPDPKPHHYHFQVFALDRPLNLPEGSERSALVQAMRRHVLASGELVATFRKP